MKEYFCKRHGNIKEDVLHFNIGGYKTGDFCLRCAFDFLTNSLFSVEEVVKEGVNLEENMEDTENKVKM